VAAHTKDALTFLYLTSHKALFLLERTRSPFRDEHCFTLSPLFYVKLHGVTSSMLLLCGSNLAARFFIRFPEFPASPVLSTEKLCFLPLAATRTQMQCIGNEIHHERVPWREPCVPASGKAAAQTGFPEASAVSFVSTFTVSSPLLQFRVGEAVGRTANLAACGIFAVVPQNGPPQVQVFVLGS